MRKSPPERGHADLPLLAPQDLLERIRFYRQPIVDALTGRVHAYEVLSRLPDGSSAADHLAWLEAMGKIVEYDLGLPARLTPWVQGQPITLNCSADTVMHAPDKMIDAIVEHLVHEASSVTVEVTETSHATVDALEYFAFRCRTHGIRLALDDAHVGHVFALPYLLRRVRPDYVKLCGRFSRHCHAMGRAGRIERLSATIRHCEARVIIEGVEDAQMMDWAQGKGDYVQGDYVARPEPWPYPLCT